jgi:hypothetical protein
MQSIDVSDIRPRKPAGNACLSSEYTGALLCSDIRQPAHRPLYFASADSYVAQLMVVHAGQLGHSPACGQFGLDRCSGRFQERNDSREA